MRTVGIAMGLVCALTAAAVAEPVLVPSLDPPAPKAAKVAKAPKQAKKAPQKQTKKKSKRRAKQVARKRARPRVVASSSTTQVVPALDATTTAAYRYGTMTSEACVAELAARKIAYRREPATLGIVTPVRLTGPLQGITIRTNQKTEQRSTSRWEIADCRLVLAIDDYARILAKHDVVEVRHYSMYRTPPTSFGKGDVATRHPGGLALDAARFIRRDGSYLDVEEHYHGRIGQQSCGDGADPPSPATAEAVELRAILCETVAAKLFNVVLTPNHDRPHRNHFHLEVTPSVKWFLVK